MVLAKYHWIHNSKVIEVTGGLYLLLVRMIGTHQLVGCWMALLETNNRISCAPIMQSLPCLMTQAKTFLIYHNKAVEVTGALYWLLVRRIGTHGLVCCWMDLKLTFVFLVNWLCRAFKLRHIGYTIARRWKWRERSISFWYKELELICSLVVARLLHWQLQCFLTNRIEPSLLHGISSIPLNT